MPQPGWYADPDGTPERLRWWDGTRWTENVHGGDEAATAAASRRRGPWPWVALVTVAGLVVAVGFGLSSGLLGRDSVLGTAGAVESGTPLPAPSTSRTPSAEPSLPQLPPVTPDARTSPPSFSPTPFPSIPATPVVVDPDPVCPPAVQGALSDGQLELRLPSKWVGVDGLTWLGCTQAATSPKQAASVTLGQSVLPTTDLQEVAEYMWGIALLDVAVPHPMSQTSTPVTVAGLDGWMVTGTVGLRDQLDELTVIVVDVGAEVPSVVVTLVGTHDEAGHAAIDEVLASLRPA